ncbi:MAG: glycosyltransferase family protein [Candidatus Pacebacteria bacterium]|nr:glycosyltransferase family protein [Candidatus Paceibacterota bacterium]
MKIIAVIQAKVGSKRLPNKAFEKVAGVPSIDHVIDRVLRSKEIDGVAIATSSAEGNEIFESKAQEKNIGCFRGSESDILERLYLTAKKFGADVILRITGDSPFVDPHVIDQLVSEYRKRSGEIVFASTCLPMTFPEGLSMELVSFSVLEKLNKEMTDPNERGTFMLYISRNPEKFPRYALKYKKDASRIRLTLDYPEDLILARRIYDYFYGHNKKHFGLDEVISLLEKNPGWVEINQHRADRSKYPFVYDKEAELKAL